MLPTQAAPILPQKPKLPGELVSLTGPKQIAVEVEALPAKVSKGHFTHDTIGDVLKN